MSVGTLQFMPSNWHILHSHRCATAGTPCLPARVRLYACPPISNGRVIHFEGSSPPQRVMLLKMGGSGRERWPSRSRYPGVQNKIVIGIALSRRHRSEPHFATTRTHPLDPEVTFALGGSGRPMFKVTGTAWLYRAGSSDRRNGVDRRVSYD